MKITNNVRMGNPVVSLRANGGSLVVSLRASETSEAIFFRLLRHFVPRNDGRRNLFVHLAMTPLVILLATLFYFTIPSAYADDWPQVQHDPQHSGYSPETLGTNFRVAWTHPFQPDRVHPQTQAIIYNGKVFVGTEGANGQRPSLYVLDAVNPDPSSPTSPIWQRKGRVLWKFEADGPILNSAAAYNGIVYFATLNGSVYGVDATSGTLVWRNQLSVDRGFTAAPLIADNKLLIGGQDGYFYALNTHDGTIAWSYNLGFPVFMTAAYDNGKVFFAAHDMSIYALNTTDGSLAWKSNKLTGIALKDYWPVVTQGRVIVRPFANNGDPGPKGPTFYVLNEDTGAIDTSYPQNDNNTMDGATPPPCVDRDGKLVIPAGAIGGTWESGWGRLDLATKNVETISVLNVGGTGNPDETNTVTCSHNLIIVYNTWEFSATFNGFYDLDNKTWTSALYNHVDNQMSVNTQGGGANPVSISNGMIYHLVWHELVARTTN